MHWGASSLGAPQLPLRGVPASMPAACMLPRYDLGLIGGALLGMKEDLGGLSDTWVVRPEESSL